MKIQRNLWSLVFLLNLCILHADHVEIISDMYTEEILNNICFHKLKSAYTLRIVDQKYKLSITTKDNTVKRYLIFNSPDNLVELDLCPSEKKVLFMMEPMRISYQDAQAFSRVYTWDDDLIDGKKFFKFYFPDLLPMIDPLPSFEEKKLCTMIVRNWSPKHRHSLIEFFYSKPKGEFEFYGSLYPKLAYNKLYRGRIPGFNCGQEKISVLKNYRFCICFENSVDLRGYVTEKIFPCFAAGCIPIYWGAPNIEDYIPKSCFIDYRDFKNNEELYQFIKGMSKDIYENYLDSIRTFLCSEQAQLFSPENFAQTLYEAVNQ